MSRVRSIAGADHHVFSNRSRMTFIAADRLAALGGRLRVESPPDGGTRIIATLPL